MCTQALQEEAGHANGQPRAVSKCARDQQASPILTAVVIECIKNSLLCKDTVLQIRWGSRSHSMKRSKLGSEDFCCSMAESICLEIFTESCNGGQAYPLVLKKPLCIATPVHFPEQCVRPLALGRMILGSAVGSRELSQCGLLDWRSRLTNSWGQTADAAAGEVGRRLFWTG